MLLGGVLIVLYWLSYHKGSNENRTPIPEEFGNREYSRIWKERTEGPSIWPQYTLPKWRASLSQQQKLDRIIGISSEVQGIRKQPVNWNQRRDMVKAAAKHAWDAYVRDAFGSDEYYPLEKRGELMTPKGVGYFIADVLDTLWLMGLDKEYKRGRDYLAANITFDQPGKVSLFETTIRVLGGILSAYHLSGETDTELLRLADELGGRLSRSFNTDTGIPPETAHLQQPLNEQPSAVMSSTSEVTSLHLEFRYLAKLTGKMEYKKSVDRIMDIVIKASRFDGLVPIYINAMSGEFVEDEIRVGSRGDSYYEYLLKIWLQTKQSENVYRFEYDRAIEGIKKYLVTTSPHQGLTYVGELMGIGDQTKSPRFNPKMDHLVCFLAGSLALGATNGKPLSEISPDKLTAYNREDLVLAGELAETCAHMYFDTPTGLSPELVYFRHGQNSADRSENQMLPPDGDILAYPNDRHNILRPETVESLFILWKITGEQKWRDYGWRIFQSFEKWAKLSSGGYVSLQNVNVIPPPKNSKMETFFVAETLKYLYLLFSDGDQVPLTKYVFNTEAHPLPLFNW